MRYKINDIFYSIQGEGHYTGRPALFIRFSGCNLKCPWCDTNHNRGIWYTKEQLEQHVIEDFIKHPNTMIVFTGGEPTLQLKEEEELFRGYFRTIETNGIIPVPSWINWITLSPKTDIKVHNIPFENFPDEIKIVFEESRLKYLKYIENSCAGYFRSDLYLQPLEKDGRMNLEETIDYVKEHPIWKLGIQTQKFIGIK